MVLDSAMNTSGPFSTLCSSLFWWFCRICTVISESDDSLTKLLRNWILMHRKMTRLTGILQNIVTILRIPEYQPQDTEALFPLNVSSLSNHTTSRHFLYVCSCANRTIHIHVYRYIYMYVIRKDFVRLKSPELNATTLLETLYGFDRFYNFDGDGYARSDTWWSRSRCAGYPLFLIELHDHRHWLLRHTINLIFCQ